MSRSDGSSEVTFAMAEPMSARSLGITPSSASTRATSATSGSLSRRRSRATRGRSPGRADRRVAGPQPVDYLGDHPVRVSSPARVGLLPASRAASRSGEPGGDACDVAVVDGAAHHLGDALLDERAGHQVLPGGGVVGELVDDAVQLGGGQRAAQDAQQREVVLLGHAVGVAGTQPRHHPSDEAVRALGDDGHRSGLRDQGRVAVLEADDLAEAAPPRSP